jgi:hypothetical protein
MFSYLAREAGGARLAAPPPPPAPPVETPPTGCLHPAAPGRFFASPAEYVKWYAREGPLRDDPSVPTVAVLLYRKHVITELPYIAELIEKLEAEGVRPVPVFLNGVEAHTVVRDLLTTAHEHGLRAAGRGGELSPTLAADAPAVDAVVSPIGVPLVGGPAGPMEGGRQADIAAAILRAKDVPYIVAAPLLIQVRRFYFVLLSVDCISSICIMLSHRARPSGPRLLGRRRRCRPPERRPLRAAGARRRGRRRPARRPRRRGDLPGPGARHAPGGAAQGLGRAAARGARRAQARRRALRLPGEFGCFLELPVEAENVIETNQPTNQPTNH